MEKPRHSEAWSQALDAVEKSSGGLISHNVRVSTRRTSLRLDALTWRALHEVAKREGVTVHECMLRPADRKRAKISQRRRDGEFSHSLQDFCDVVALTLPVTGSSVRHVAASGGGSNAAALRLLR
jgi:predicted DNA-binding ribbon-helix-helix protein